MIIDAHTHIFPDEQAACLLQRTARMFNVATFGKATARDLLETMDVQGVDLAVIHMVSPTPAGVAATNTWLVQLRQDRFIKFGTLHPDSGEFNDAIERLIDGNVRGIKLQPDIQQFTPDDRDRTYPLYEALARYQLPVMFHVGGEPYPSLSDRSHPRMIGRIADDFPELTIIAAHLGGLNMWDQALEHLAGRTNVYLESSLSYRFIEPEQAQRIIRRHGHRKIFFGTDYPFGDVGHSLAIARTVPFLNNAERTDILGRNAYEFFFS